MNDSSVSISASNVIELNTTSGTYVQQAFVIISYQINGGPNYSSKSLTVKMPVMLTYASTSK